MPNDKNVDKLVKNYKSLQNDMVGMVKDYNKVQQEIEQLHSLRIDELERVVLEGKLEDKLEDKAITFKDVFKAIVNKLFKRSKVVREDNAITFEDVVLKIKNTIEANGLFKTGKFYKSDKIRDDVESYIKRLQSGDYYPNKADIEIDAMEKIKFVESNKIVDKIEKKLEQVRNIENALAEIKSDIVLPRNDEIAKWSPKRYELKSYTVVERDAGANQVLSKENQAKVEKDFMRIEREQRRKKEGKRPSKEQDKQTVKSSRRRNNLKLRANKEISKYQHSKTEAIIDSISQQSRTRNDKISIQQCNEYKNTSPKKEKNNELKLT